MTLVRAARSGHTTSAAARDADAPIAAAEPAPSQEHRIVTLLAAISLLYFVGGAWSTLVVGSPAGGTAFGAVFPLLLVTVAVVLGARRRRTLVLVDAGLIVLALGTTLVRIAPPLWHPHYAVDESVLMYRAIQAVAHGHNPYAGDWSAQVARVPTLLLDGSHPGRFGYPPLSAVLGGGLARLVGSERAPILLMTLSMLATAAILYRVLPVARRGLVVPAVGTITVMPFLAAMAYPAALMIPLLVVACHRSARIGRGGELGRRGLLQGTALGLALATQQLAWFVAPFLLVVVWRARRGELDRRPAALVVLRLGGTALAAFAVVNLPFVVVAPHLWLRGITDPLLQHAMFNGPGLPNLTLRVVGGGGQLGYWSVAAVVVFAGLLVATASWPRLLGAGAVVLPFIALWASMRAQTLYYNTALPLVFAAAATSGTDFAAARPLRFGRLPRWVVPGAAAVAVVGLAAAAMLTPAPLRVQVDAVEVRAANSKLLRSLSVFVRNTSDHDVTPHVTTDTGAKFGPFLRQVFGPRTLRPGQAAELVLVPPSIRPKVPRPHIVYIVSDDPATVSTARVPR